MPALTDISILNLAAGMLFGGIGFVGFVYGKKMNLWRPMFIGIALMGYSYFVENTALLCAFGIVGTGALFLLRE